MSFPPVPGGENQDAPIPSRIGPFKRATKGILAIGAKLLSELRQGDVSEVNFYQERAPAKPDHAIGTDLPRATSMGKTVVDLHFEAPPLRTLSNQRNP